MEDKILHQGQSKLVVHPKLHCFNVFAKEITQQSSLPKCLSRGPSAQLNKATTCCLTTAS
jgi:hypothetical protein